MKLTTVLLTLLAVFAPAGSYANETGRIVGTIHDPDATYSGLCWVLAIPCVSMLDCATGGTPTVIEAATLKEFEIPNLEPGLYKVAVISSGAGAWASSTFFLPGGQTATVSPVLPEIADSYGIVFENHTPEDLEDFADLLAPLGESPLCGKSFAQDSPHEHYRVIWERTFHPLVVVNLSLYGEDGFTARYKESSGDSYEEVELAVDESTNVAEHLVKTGFDQEETLAFRELISEKAECDGFWDLPYRVEDGSLVLDGSLWTIEGVKNGRCHIVSRRSPDRGDPVREFAWEIIMYTGRQFVYEEVY